MFLFQIDKLREKYLKKYYKVWYHKFGDIMKKMFDKTIIKKCGHCLFGTDLGDDGEIICKKRGIVNKNDLCRKYKYDPLKREPQKQIISDNYSPEDFKI